MWRWQVGLDDANGAAADVARFSELSGGSVVAEVEVAVCREASVWAGEQRDCSSVALESAPARQQ